MCQHPHVHKVANIANSLRWCAMWQVHQQWKGCTISIACLQPGPVTPSPSIPLATVEQARDRGDSGVRILGPTGLAQVPLTALLTAQELGREGGAMGAAAREQTATLRLFRELGYVLQPLTDIPPVRRFWQVRATPSVTMGHAVPWTAEEPHYRIRVRVGASAPF